MEVENETPKSKSNLVNKVVATAITCDSPFRILPNISTPPSRFTRIVNPFESHLIDRLHLPTFSPSVFAQGSTPKTDNKFKWTIDDISSLKPADIDDATVHQHVSDHDSMVEFMVQEKINTFFDKVIVPSPLNVQANQMVLVKADEAKPKAKLSNGSTQTILTFPPTLPDHIEEVLKPYFSYDHDQQEGHANQSNPNTSLYHRLFYFEEQEETHHVSSTQSSPALSTGLSPINLSPVSQGFADKRTFESPIEMPELRDCNLSPIGRSLREARSACRLSFSGHMSVDGSLVVPDINRLPSRSTSFVSERDVSPPTEDLLNNSTMNWDMEYKEISILSRTPPDTSLEDISATDTPHSRIFTNLRKRLSDSFKRDELLKDADVEEAMARRNKNRLVAEDVTDAGYHTGENSTWNSSHMFASTPTKNKF